MNEIAVRYCSHPDGHAPADCPELERDRLLARVARLEEALASKSDAAIDLALGEARFRTALEHIANEPCDHGPMPFCPRDIARAALAEKS